MKERELFVSDAVDTYSVNALRLVAKPLLWRNCYIKVIDLLANILNMLISIFHGGKLSYKIDV